MNTPTSIHLIKGYHCLQGVLNQKQLNKISKILGLQQVDFNKRLRGKENEIEFIVLLQLLNTCKCIVGFEEGFAKLTDTITCDFFIITNNDKRLIVEVKSTENEVFTISKKQLDRKEDFARLMHAELFFAIKMNNRWMFLSSQYIKDNNRRITFDKDSSQSKFNEIFSNRSFLLAKGMRFSIVYSKVNDSLLLKVHPIYGHLISYKIQFEGRDLLTIDTSDYSKYGFIYGLSFLEDLALEQNKTITAIDSDTTLVETEFTEFVCFSLVNMMCSLFIHLVENMMKQG